MAPTIVRRPPYKDFLQPALHRRFSTTTTILLSFAYLEAIFLSNWNSLLWSWFPIGPTGLRAFFLSICGLLIIILRIHQYHPGVRTSDSGFQTFKQHVLNQQTIETLFAYGLSSSLFSLVYLRSLSRDSGLELIAYVAGGRPRLNEKSLFFAAHFFILGITQALLHLFKDNDRLSLGTVRKQNSADAGKTQNGDPAVMGRRFWDQMPVILISAINQSLIGLVATCIVYPLFLRQTVWHATMTVCRWFYNLPRTNMLPPSLPFSRNALFRCWIASVLLLLMWTAGNAAFSIFLVKEPLKNGRPLTSESRDPNGSLLNGLKSKKLSIQCFAMWELAFIARDYPERRKAIYEDIDRKDGPMWTQVYGICMGILKDMESRIDSYGKPPQPSAPAAVESVEPKKRTTEPPKNASIFQERPRKIFREEVEKVVAKTVTSPGQSGNLGPAAKNVIYNAKEQLLKVQREATGYDDPQGLFTTTALKVLKTIVGWPFRQEYSRRLAHVVLGAPYGEPSLLINATYALSQLTVYSLDEDKYGNVQRDISTIIRTLTTVATKLENFKTNLPTHWTDIARTRESPEVDAILAAVKEALAQLIEEFGPFARDLRLSLTDMRLAREAAGVAANQEQREPGYVLPTDEELQGPRQGRRWARADPDQNPEMEQV
ncbi:nucleoporin protein Ndc1-Nup [Podospora appendiculata]|uniref:Nucleoporin protein Ndc1-Nup n=1 Tax=Podospora appendiculata TaxID=314037 RepID=A0AAE0X4B7_9PEZI|nr:nucleoporin protein Ndc1-Nup [Podospora appendiculata]